MEVACGPNRAGNCVTKFRVTDGANEGMMPVAHQPQGLAFEGSNVWVSLYGDGTVRKLDEIGNVVQPVSVGTGPRGAVLDVTCIWVTNSGEGTVSKVRVSDGGPACHETMCIEERAV